ncbi:MAG: thioredoxin family protein [Flavobacteriaceae bacterium]
MRRLVVFLFVIICGCSTSQELLGPIELNQLKQPPYSEWFTTEYENYKPFIKTTEQLKDLLQDVEIKVFMGTWCSDSQMQVPAFFRILGTIDYNGEVSIIAVDKEKKTPSGSAAKSKITHVPTFIFYKNGEEINRIVESPVDFLEDDMRAILSGAAYKHIYQD